MLIDRPGPEDAARVLALAKLTGSGFDPVAELARDYAKLSVARREPGGEPVGFALVWRAADELHLLDLVVEPASRRSGIGRELVEQVIAGARVENLRVVLLEVRASNVAAIALYHSAGFVESGVRRGYYSDNDEDAVLMRLELGSVPPSPERKP